MPTEEGMGHRGNLKLLAAVNKFHPQQREHCTSLGRFWSLHRLSLSLEKHVLETLKKIGVRIISLISTALPLKPIGTTRKPLPLSELSDLVCKLR